MCTDCESADGVCDLPDVGDWGEADELGPDELAASLLQLDQSMANIAAGSMLTVAEARRHSLSNLISAEN